jgi:UDP-galactopyranose mutase
MADDEGPVEFLILGAGFAGLGAGVEAARRGRDSLILEAAAEPGGLCRSTTVHGCVFDHGPKVLLPGTPDPGIAAELLGHLDDGYDSYPMRQQTYLTGVGLVGFPVQRHLVDLPAGERRQILADLPAGDPAPEDLTCYRNWLLRTYGRRLCETVLFPYEEKKWRAPLDSMDYEWARNRRQETRADIIEGATRRLPPNSRYYYPLRGGISVLSESLAHRAGPIRYHAEVTEIREAERYVVAGGVRYRYEHLISTLPLDRALAMGHEADRAFVDAATDVLRWLAVRVFNLVFAGDTDIDGTAISFPDPDIPFRRLCVLQNLCPALARKGMTPLSVETSLHPSEPAPDEAAQLDAALGAIARLPFLSELGELLGHQVLTLDYAYPRLRRRLGETVRAVHAFHRKYDIHHCGRCGNFDYCNSDAAYAQGKQVVARLIDERPESATRPRSSMRTRR